MSKLLRTAMFFALLVPFSSGAQLALKTYIITKAPSAPVINGLPDDDLWATVPAATDFQMHDPVEGLKATERTEVKMAYDQTGIYIAAMMYDDRPDSIMRQLGIRDADVEADKLTVAFDTYGKSQDAFRFIINASGVQQEFKDQDYNYDAVWQSAVKILPNGWSAEMKIPYSALRFPTADGQAWRMQLSRNIPRKHEFDQWALTSKTVSNALTQWGYLEGLKDIQEPLRLSFTPYTTAAFANDQAEAPGYRSSYTLSGGLDVKYGINKSFTVDATLLPDFSQVQSDDKIKNLSAFEVTYGENRPFFKEGTDIFQKGDIFYSRRIGHMPEGYYSVSDSLRPGEIVKRNPTQSRLLNAVKLSGRTSGGLGIGILNAVQGNTYAEVIDENGYRRDVLSDPFTNYNLLVLDQQIKNGSDVFFVNGNVIRGSGFPDANVSAGGFTLNNKSNTYSIGGGAAVSNRFIMSPGTDFSRDIAGLRYAVSFSKTQGKFQFWSFREAIQKDYNQNDIGITRETNVVNNTLDLNYNEPNPFWKLLNLYNNLSFHVDQNYTTQGINTAYINTFSGATLRNYYFVYGGIYYRPFREIDYYEPRNPGRIFKRAPGMSAFTGFNSDSKRKLVMDLTVNYGISARQAIPGGRATEYGIDISPNWRASNRLTLSGSVSYNVDNSALGYAATTDSGAIIFGARDLHTLSELIYCRYIFRRNLSLSLRARHYWITGNYTAFFNLTDNGMLDPSNYSENEDFTYNAFTIDTALEWQFAPGSSLSLIWKNNISDESPMVISGYGDNISHVFSVPQQNTISLKVLYYFDALYLAKKNAKV